MTASRAKQFYSNPSNYYLSKAYNCDDSNISPDHAVVIIGWDDNYSVNNFNADHRPTSPGAWLVQNSYGTEVTTTSGNKVPIFDNGLMYISYEDCIIEQAIFGMINVAAVNYDNIYQYDNLGSSSIISASGTFNIYTANVFTRKSDNEYITEISFATNGSKDYVYDILLNSEDGTLSRTKLKSVKTISGTDSDYITVKLDSPIKINGSKFAVAVNYINSADGVEAPVEARINLQSDNSWKTASSNRGESFLSANEGLTWTDLKDVTISNLDNMNACIKVFTNANITLTSKTYKVENSKNIITKVPANTNVTEFKNNITTNSNIKLYDKNDKELSNSTIIATGMKLKLPEIGKIYNIVVQGDVNGDGKVSTTDLLNIKKQIVGIKTLLPIYQMAADVNYDSKLTVTDVIGTKKIISGI